MQVKFISAHQPSFMPWLGYLHRIALSSVFIVLDDVQFEKNSFTNRNIIQNKSNKSYQWLTLPVLLKGHFSNSIKDIKINNQINWKRKHLMTISQEYKDLPYFDQRFKTINEIYEKDHLFFSEFSFEMLKYILDLFSIETKILKQTDLLIAGKGTNLIASICARFNIENFIFGLEGKNYLNKDFFKKQNCKAFEHNYICNYSNIKTNNKSNLSCLDLIFRHDRDSLSKILHDDNEFTLTQL